MSYYYECPYCSANLDPGEKCDCREDVKQETKKIVIGNTVHTCNSKLNSRKEALANA